MELIELLRKKAEACDNKTKESRARKGAYVDCIVLLEEEFDKGIVLDADWIQQEPEPHEIETLPDGGRYISIEKLRILLDRMNAYVTNYKSAVITTSKEWYAYGSLELTVTIDGKQRTVTGASNLNMNDAIGGYWNGTLKSDCVKNAAQELGRRLGRGLNVSEGVVSGEKQKVEIKKRQPDEKIMQQFLKAVEEKDLKTIATLNSIYQIES